MLSTIKLPSVGSRSNFVLALSLWIWIYQFLSLFFDCCCCLIVKSLPPHGLWPARLLCPWDFPGKILEWVAIFFSRGPSPPEIKPSLLHCRQLLYHRATRKAQAGSHMYLQYACWCKNGLWNSIFVDVKQVFLSPWHHQNHYQSA